MIILIIILIVSGFAGFLGFLHWLYHDEPSYKFENGGRGHDGINWK